MSEDDGNCHEFVPLISVDIDAIRDESDIAGFNRGYAKGREDAYLEIKQEVIGDIIFRLRAMIDNGRDFNECLMEIESMK